MATETLSASFGLDIAPLTQSLKRATNSVSEATQKMGKESFGSLLSPIAKVAAAVASVGAIMEGIHGSLELGAEMQDLSNRTGIAVGSLYMLRKSFKDAGMDAEKLGPAVAKMQKTLAGSASGGGESSLLHAMGLDAKTLASEAPDKAFQQIGEAIHKLPNATEQAAAAMKIFGKSGAELLAVFNSPAFQEGGHLSNTAKILNDNAASFKEASETLNHVGGKLQGFFIGLSSSFVPALLPLLKQFDKMDFSSWGQSLGNVIGNFSTNFTDEIKKIGQFMKDIVSLAFSADGLTAFGEGFISIGAKLKDALIYAFKTPLDYLEAGMQHAIESVMEQIGNIPIIGKASGLNGFQATSFDNNLKEVQARGNGLTNQAAADKAAAPTLASDFNEKVTRLTDELKKSLHPAFKATSATNLANAQGRVDAAQNAIPNGNFNANDLGAGRYSMTSDSLARIGGGGNSIGGVDPILQESKNQSKSQQKILEAVLALKAAQQAAKAQFAE